MPYGKRRYQKSSIKNRRNVLHKKPSARNQKKQILSNQNQIVSIRQQLNLNKERIRWRCGFSEYAMTSYPFIIPLTSGPSTASPAVTSSGNAVTWDVTMTSHPQDISSLRSKVVVNTQWIDLSVTGGNEASPLYITGFVVQLQEKTAREVYAETVQMSTLTRDRDFATPINSVGADSGYGAYLNNARFKIIKRLEFCTLGPTIGWPGGPPGGDVGSGLGAAVHRTQFKLNYGNTVLKATGDGATSNDLPYDKIASKHKRFIILFSDNSLLDNEYPNVAMSSLITGYAAE
ncbi:MAG: hypothetical protein [Circular genetic element sp.]|nr:MAG: hypothetical protein [Circular genetic element sp.]